MSYADLNLLILQFKVVLVPAGHAVLLVMPHVSTPVTVQVCVDLEHSVYLDVRENTTCFTTRSDIAYNLIYFDHGKSDWLLKPIQHLFLAEKVVVQFLVQVFRVLASTNKVVFMGEFENVNVRHSLQVLLITM